MKEKKTLALAKVGKKKKKCNVKWVKGQLEVRSNISR